MAHVERCAPCFQGAAAASGPAVAGSRAEILFSTSTTHKTARFCCCDANRQLLACRSTPSTIYLGGLSQTSPVQSRRAAQQQPTMGRRTNTGYTFAHFCRQKTKGLSGLSLSLSQLFPETLFFLQNRNASPPSPLFFATRCVTEG